MVCSCCGRETPLSTGRCTFCRAPLAASVAAGVLTSPPDSSAAPVGATRPPSSPSQGAVRLAIGPLVPGQEFASRYHIIRVLGEGSTGIVYQAWDQQLEKAVAVKVIRPDALEDPLTAHEVEKRFAEDLPRVQRITHPNLVRVYELGDAGGLKFLTMPYVQGQTLATVLTTASRQPVSVALRVGKAIAAGLKAAHDVGLVHGGLSPANILIEGDRPLIMDLGTARLVPALGVGGTMAGAAAREVAHLAPEQARGQPVDQRADIYTFGLMLYDMLAGSARSEAAADPISELMGRLQEPPPSLRAVDPTIPEAVDRVVTRCVQPDPDARYQSMRELVADLEALGPDGRLLPAAAPQPDPTSFTAPEPDPRRGRLRAATRTETDAAILERRATFPWRWRVLTAGAGALLLLVLAAVVARDRWSGAPPAPPPALAPPPPLSLAVLPFQNASGDATIDWVGPTLAELVTMQIGQSARVRTVTPDRLDRILSELRIAAGGGVDVAGRRRVAELSRADVVVWGRYARAGDTVQDKFQIDASLDDVKRQTIVQLKAGVASEDALLGAIAGLARSIREGLGLSPEVVKELEAQAFKPSSDSLPALRYFTEGAALARQGKPSEAVKRFELATVNDPGFALAYSRVGQMHATLGYDSEAVKFSRRAVELSAALPPREQYVIAANHARLINDNKKAIEAYEALLKLAPDDPDVHFDLAGHYDAIGSFDLARDHYDKVVARDPNYLDALLGIGRVETKRRNPQRALESLNRALSLAVQVNNEEGKANILSSIGTAYKRLNQPREALGSFQQALDIQRRLDQKGGIAATLNEMGQIQKRLARVDLALANYNEALRLRREIGDKRGIGSTLLDLGSLEIDRGRYDDALRYFKESLQIQREIGNQNYEALVLNNIGNVYYFKGQYEDALTYYERTLPLRERAKIAADLVQSLHNLAETYLKMGQYDQTLGYYLRAIEQGRLAGDKRGVAIEAYSLGALFDYQGRYGAALKSKEEALKTFRDLQDRTFWMAEVLSGYGNTLGQLGRLDAAQQSLEEALRLARDLQNDALVAQTLNFQGDALLLRGDAKTARSLFAQALQAASRTADRPMILLSRVNLAKVAAAEGPGAESVATLSRLSKEADALGLKYLSLDGSLAAAEARLKRGEHAAARLELEALVGRTERLGARTLQARSHHLLATALRLSGSAAEARRQYNAALRMLDEIRKETGSDDPMTRRDLSFIRADATRWVTGGPA